MTGPAAMRRTIEDLQERIERLEAMVAGRPRAIAAPDDAGVDQTALDRAIRDLVRGNSMTLDRYLRRGGKIPRAQGESHGAESD